MSNLKDFATSVVVTPPSPAASGTTLTVTSGHGVRFPATPFNATVCPDGEMPTLDNAEKVVVTNIASDTLTITRAQSPTTAMPITAGWRISNALFAADAGGSAAWGSITGTLSSQSDLQTALDAKQPLDSDLTAVAGLSATGIIARTGSGTVAARTITAGSAKISITNGNGVSGNPTADLGSVASTDLSDGGTLYKSGGTDVAITDGGTGASTLPTGLLKGAGTSPITAATQGTDYYAPAGTDVAVTDGGTGASTASAARTNLGLAIGTDVQAFNANTTTQGNTVTGTGSIVLANTPTILTPTIVSFTNAAHDHSNAAGGGQITDAALSAAVSVAKGGSGRTTATTAYGLIAAGTTATGAQQTVAPGTIGQFLRSNGASALPSMQTMTYEAVTQIQDISNGVTATTYQDGFIPCIFDKSKYSGYSGIYFRGSLVQGNAGTFLCSGQLYNVTAGAVITGSQVSASLAQFARSIFEVEISAALPNSAAAFWLQSKVASGGSTNIEGGSIVVRYS